MPTQKRKKVNHRFKLKFIHLGAVIFLIVYNILSKTNLVWALTLDDHLESFLRLFAFGVITTYVFKYIFSHEDFFQFAKELKKQEEKKEKDYLKKYKRYGKILLSFIIAALGGPIFLALTLRLLFHRKPIANILIPVVILLSTIITFFFGKGVVKLF